MFWVVWIVIAVAALIGEMVTLALVLGSLAAAALLTVGLSFFLPLPLQAAGFGVLSLLLLFGVRPVVIQFLPIGGSGHELPGMGPVGKTGVVLEQVDSDRGQIRVGQGEFWTARVADVGTVIPSLREVRIVAVDGLTALVEPIVVPPSIGESGGDTPFGLSPREVEVLQLVADGLTNAEIAERLVLSVRTVHHHVSHIFDKMGVKSRMDAVRLGITRGIVQAR